MRTRGTRPPAAAPPRRALQRAARRNHGTAIAGVRWTSIRSTPPNPPHAISHDHPPHKQRPDEPVPTWVDHWHDVSRRLRKDHGELTDADLSYTRGQVDDLFHRLGSRLGRSEQQARELVEQAARNAPHNPQDRSMLKDQRDRTTGADQATRTDTPVDEPDTSGTRPKDHG